MTLTINGVDFSQYTDNGGIKYKRVDIDGGQGGISIMGSTIVDIYTSKMELELKFQPLTATQLKQILLAVAPETFPAVIEDPRYASGDTFTMMVTQPPQATVSKREKDGTVSYRNVSMTLREV